jgi:spermidine/putrescine transport system permease protein
MKQSKFCTIVLTLVLIFLYLPVAVLIANSFNMSKYGGEWSGFTFKWYAALFSPSNREI